MAQRRKFAATLDGRPLTVVTRNQERPLRLTMTVPEAAAALGVSRATAYAAARDGSLPVVRIRTRLLVPKRALDELLTNGGAVNV